jgi:hypothetical protein
MVPHKILRCTQPTNRSNDCIDICESPSALPSTREGPFLWSNENNSPRPQRLDMFTNGRTCPHIAVHRWRNDEWAPRCEHRRKKWSVSDTEPNLSDAIRGRWRDNDCISPITPRDMFNFSRVLTTLLRTRGCGR